MSFHLYQLQLGSKVGDLVRINGPHDTWGRVREIRENGFHLIRGLGHQRPKQ